MSQYYSQRRNRNTDSLIDNMSGAAPKRASRSASPRPDRSPLRPNDSSNFETTISEVQEVGGSQLQLINHYRRNVLRQAQQSFVLALVAAGIGLIFFLGAVSFLILRQPTSISITSLVSGSLIEVISAINFYLYGRTSRQLSYFHVYLDRTCRFLVSERACERIVDKEMRDKTISKLIMTFMETAYTGSEAFDSEVAKTDIFDER